MDIIELCDLNFIGDTSPKNSDDKLNVENCDVPYVDFFKKYLYTNVPCLINNVSKHWKCQSDWTQYNNPNIEYLRDKYGTSIAPVANCQERYYNAQNTENMTLDQFMNYWENYICKNHCNSLPCLYLKDWHFTKEYPHDDVYRVPNLFASDWLNEYFIESKALNDDYKFVYMGPKGTWTPLHADVFSSFSWSVNICGSKKWIFYPPGQEYCLKDRFGHLAYDVQSKDLNDSSMFPNYEALEGCIELIQGAGDAIFVPSGWHHQVWNLEDTISINHNWVNGCNINHMWEALQGTLEDIRKEIEHCKEMENWEEQCQLMLKASYGMDYSGFCDFIIFVAQQRLNHLTNGTYLNEPGNWLLGRNHMIFDLKQLIPIFQAVLALKLAFIDPFREKIQTIISETCKYL